MKFYKIFFSLILFSGYSFGQFTEFHPELDWYTIKGKHVEVHFHEGAERSAKIVCKIADEVWDPICSLYGYEPDVVHFVIKDIDDYSNGATYFFDNKIEIWTSALDFDLRGTHNWLRNVISHEFTHMVQIQSSMKASRGLPAVFLQVLNYEDERRPDILYGFPNFIVSYPLATINVPAWFAEGTAQYMRKEFDYDRWDSHRDMILRTYALDGNMLTWNQMGVFGKTSLGNESVYNSGFALTRYIAQKYGEKKLAAISKALGSFWNFTIDAAFKDALGKDGNEIYNEWRDFVTKSYIERTAELRTNLITGDALAKDGFGNFYPVFSEDGSKFIYVSNKSSDYFGLSGIYLYDFKTKEEKMLVGNARSTVGWVPGKNKIIYSKLTDDNPNWYNVHDLYVYDIDKDEETRLTNDLRANQPCISNDGKKIAFLFQKDGTTNLGIVDFNIEKDSANNFKQLTNFNDGEQVYNPKFSNDDSYIIFDYSYHQTRDIFRINPDGSNYKVVISTDNDERNPVIDKDGNMIYASDETGIYNLYKLDFKTGQKTQLTNVLGGAFMPAVADNGDILYAGYTSTGYKIFHIIPEQQKKVIAGKDYKQINNPPLEVYSTDGDFTAEQINHLKNFNDYQIPDYDEKPYTGVFSKLTFFPFIRYDNYNTSNKFLEKIKPGLLATSSDMLNRYALFAGGSINSRLERDLFLIFDYRNKLPLLFNLGIKPELSLELYNISRKANVNVSLFPDTSSNGTINYQYNIPTDVTYNLFEVDFIAKHQIFSRSQNLEFKFIFSQYSAALGSFLLPNDNGLYPTTNDRYLIGRNFQLKYTLDAMLPYVDGEINPVGVQLDLTYNYEFNKFNSEGNYVVENGLLKPAYNDFDFHRLELNSKIHFPLWANHTLTVQLRGGTILGPAVPDFFDFYLGGLIGMRAYTFYAISGNEIAWANLTYRFPLFRNIDARAGHLYLDKIYFSVYGDLGNAWTGKIPELKSFKKGAGAELRIQMSSYYLFPTCIFLNAAYGFDKFDRIVNDEVITYGKEWQFYGGILFGFDI